MAEAALGVDRLPGPPEPPGQGNRIQRQGPPVRVRTAARVNGNACPQISQGSDPAREVVVAHCVGAQTAEGMGWEGELAHGEADWYGVSPYAKEVGLGEAIAGPGEGLCTRWAMTPVDAS